MDDLNETIKELQPLKVLRNHERIPSQSSLSQKLMKWVFSWFWFCTFIRLYTFENSTVENIVF